MSGDDAARPSGARLAACAARNCLAAEPPPSCLLISLCAAVGETSSGWADASAGAPHAAAEESGWASGGPCEGVADAPSRAAGSCAAAGSQPGLDGSCCDGRGGGGGGTRNKATGGCGSGCCASGCAAAVGGRAGELLEDCAARSSWSSRLARARREALSAARLASGDQ